MWKKLLLIILITAFSSFAESYINIYSIQVISTKDIKKAKNVYKKISKYPYTRIEKIGSYYVVRVGNTRFTKELKPLLKEIKKFRKDSFIRIADIIPERIILANFKFKKEKVKSMIKEKKPDNQEKIKTKKEEKFKIVKDTKDILSLIPDINIKNKTVKIEKTEKQKIKIQQDKVLNIEISKVNKDGIKKTLKKYKDTLPYRDKVYAEDIVGRVNEALNTSYRNLKRSKEDYLAYKQFVDLYTKYSNRFKSQINYEYFEDISRFYLKYQLKKYLWLNSYLYIDNENYFTTSYKKSNYKKLPSIDSLLTIGIKKIFNSSDIIIKLGVRKSVELFPILSIDYNFKTNKYWDSTLSLGINQRAEESNLSFYGASKTNLKYSTTISINSKNVISGSTSINNYYSQDFKEIGNGYYFESRYLHKYRIGYPDFSNYIQLSGGFYNEKSNKTGSINKILITPNTQVLPDNFIEACIGSLFGINYIYSYKKQLRPFMDTNICYNTAYSIGYSLFSGLAGEMFDNDNLSFGVYIGKGFFANPYTIFRLQIYYTRWF